jgi:hypothetical protein
MRDGETDEHFGHVTSRHVASPLERIEEPAPPWLHA